MSISKKSAFINLLVIGSFLTWLSGSPWASAEELSELSSFNRSAELFSLLHEALNNNPEIMTAQAQWQAAKKRIPQAAALPDPTAGYTYMGPTPDTLNGPEKDRYEFEQMIPFPGKLAGRRNAAKAEAAAQEARLRMVERDIMFKVSQAYYDLVVTQRTLALVDEIKSALRQAEAALQAQYSTSKVTQSELLKSQMEIAQNSQRIFELEQRRDTLKILLQSLLNRSSPPEVEAKELPVPTLPLSWEDIEAKARQNRPGLKESRAMLKKSQHDLNLAKLENAPDFSIGFEYSRIDAGESTSANAGQDAWMIPIKVTIPLWQNRIGSAIDEARANWKAAQARLKGSENSTDYEVKAAYYRFVTAQKTVLLYENTLLPQARLMLRSQQAGYGAGEQDAVNYVASQINFFNLQAAYSEAVANALKELASLEKEVGADLIEGED